MPEFVMVRIDNIYEDDYQFSTNVNVPAPSKDDDLTTDAWWEEHVWPQTGGRPGPNASLDAGYFAEIVRARDTVLIGLKWEWV